MIEPRQIGPRTGREPAPDAARARWAGALWLAAALLLSLATWAAFALSRHYQPVPAAWPLDPTFRALAAGAANTDPMAGWVIEGAPGSVTVADGRLHLRNDDPERSVGVLQAWRLEPGAPHAFRLTATVGSDAIAGPRPGFRVGEVTLAADGDIARPRFGTLQRLAGLSGTQAVARYVERFTFPPGTREIELAVRLRHVTGELTVGDLKLVALAERPWFVAARQALRLAWLLMLPLGCWLLARGIDHLPSGIALALAAVASFVLLMMPAVERDESLGWLGSWLPAPLAGVEPLANLGHVAIFATLGLLLRLGRRRDPWLAQIALLIAVGGMAEVLQYLAVMRSSSLADWAANAAGALLGWLPAMAWLAWLQEGQFATQRRSSVTVPPQPAKQCR
ncbi:MAG: VanZ family protein [Geminicoccaceae bacterium]